MIEINIFTMLLVALCAGLLIALCVCIRKIIRLEEQRIYVDAVERDVSLDVIAGWLMDISGQIDHLETQIPNHYKNQNGDCGILYRKEEPK